MNCSCNNRNNMRCMGGMNGYREKPMNVPCMEGENPPKKALAMAYVPWQKWGQIFDTCKALREGTIFPDLNPKFYGCIPSGYFDHTNRKGGCPS